MRRAPAPPRAPIAALALAALAAGCGAPDLGPSMEPGNDCMECHGRDAVAWTVAGTVYRRPDAPAGDGVPNVRVQLADRDGRRLTLRTNSVGNFYTREPMTPPLRVRIEKDGVAAEMVGLSPNGACNSCHAQPPAPDGPAGRITLGGG